MKNSKENSFPPEQLLKALILQALYSIRSNRMLTEQIGYSILFRWFLGMALDEPMWDHSSFTQNQQRLIGSEVSALFFDRILDQARRKRLLSAEHFTVDGTLLESWASLKSFKQRDGAPPAGEGPNHRPVPEAPLHRRGKDRMVLHPGAERLQPGSDAFLGGIAAS